MVDAGRISAYHLIKSDKKPCQRFAARLSVFCIYLVKRKLRHEIVGTEADGIVGGQARLVFRAFHGILRFLFGQHLRVQCNAIDFRWRKRAAGTRQIFIDLRDFLQRREFDPREITQMVETALVVQQQMRRSGTAQQRHGRRASGMQDGALSFNDNQFIVSEFQHAFFNGAAGVVQLDGV